jgi:PAS domain-containing protein
VPIGVIIADAKGLITQTNDLVYEICKLGDPVKNDLDHFIKDKFSAVLSSGVATHNDIFRIRCFDGTSQTMLTSISPLRGRDHRMVGVVAVIQDISEHQSVKKDIEQRITELIT